MSRIPTNKPPPPPPLRQRVQRPTRDPVRKNDEPPETSTADDGITTLGEAMQRDQELRESASPELWSHVGRDSVHDDAEDKRERDELHKAQDRVKGKDSDQRSGMKDKGHADKLPGKADPNRLSPFGAHGEEAGKAGRKDGFELQSGPLAQAQQKPKLDAPLAPGVKSSPLQEPRFQTGALHILNSARDLGSHYTELGQGGGNGQEQAPDPELEEAVEECVQLLAGVRGVMRVGPGFDEGGEPVVLIVTTRGFGESSMRAVPESVRRFRTLVVLPYDLLPLRRDSLLSR